jgi:hypothetical protein
MHAVSLAHEEVDWIFGVAIFAVLKFANFRLYGTVDERTQMHVTGCRHKVHTCRRCVGQRTMLLVWHIGRKESRKQQTDVRDDKCGEYDEQFISLQHSALTRGSAA